METRIKIVTRADGSKAYYPQCKVLWFFWSNFHGGYPHDDAIFFDSLEDAQKCLDEIIEEEKLKTQQKLDHRKVAVEFKEYP